MSGMGPNLSINTQNRYFGEAARALGLPSASYPGSPHYAEVSAYAQAFGESLNNPLYHETARLMGLSSYSSINDYQQVMARLAGGGGGADASGAGADASGGGAGQLPNPNDGSFKNIIGNIQSQGSASQSIANDYNNKPVTTSTPSAAPGATTPNTTSAAESQASALNALMIKQQEAYAKQTALQQQQIEAANAALAEQRRQADALSRAYIPAPSQTAAAPSINGYTGAGRNPNTLSSLSIMSGRSGYASSLTGLQIA